MRSRITRLERPIDFQAQSNSGNLGRALVVAVVFIGGMWAIAGTLIGMA